MAQSWHDLCFLHWPMPAQQLRNLVPRSLELDTFDGTGWVGLVPFRMTGIRLHWAPEIPGTSSFVEMNVRTYVRAGNRPGVYFFSLDANHPLAVEAARLSYHLPYYHARLTCEPEGEAIHYQNERTDRRSPPARFVADYAPTSDRFMARRGTLEHWLTERYCLYVLDRRRRVRRGEIHHQPWPLQTGKVDLRENIMGISHGIRLPDIAPLVHFARRLDVVVWRLSRPISR
ncbi:MAG: DUF2071 domain-containing protein [Planctomycetota bacterium]